MRNADRWPMHGDVSEDILNKKAFLGRELKWNCIPEYQKDKVDFIELIPDNLEDINFPDIIQTLPNLKKITIPTYLVPEMKTNLIPANVETIIVGLLGENKKKRVNWISSEIFYNITELQGVGGNVGFSHHNFPNLTNLHVNINKDESEFNEIIFLPKLQSLIVENPLTINSINELSQTNIEYLMILSGKLQSFKDVSNIDKLSKLEVRFCTVNDLNGIQNLSHVEDVEFYGCTKIIDIKPIACSSSIKRIHIIGCGAKWNDPTLPDYFMSKGFTQVRYEPDCSNSLFEAIK
ncbi:hypothetical protein [Entomohabitans teleogrylli]|uniref:hypothetical protein n=1 Tax=Entomohabitans teleogrylli TaxID=1384589 RepID=UPI00201127DD|nr:hypothetical protein [Entomohabitans teleogrylli]